MLTKAFVEKILFDDGGMEFSCNGSNHCIDFFSVKHPEVTGTLNGFDDLGLSSRIEVEFHHCFIGDELSSQFPNFRKAREQSVEFICRTEGEFEILIVAAKKLIDALPEADEDLEAAEFDPSLNETEAEAFEKQRRGQEKYRQRLEDYWQHRCAVTGIAVPEVLRASHAKAWADCNSGAERLSPYNGLLLCANLDALFDKYLISFDNAGRMLVSSRIPSEQRKLLGIDVPVNIPLVEKHKPFMAWHNRKFREHEHK